MQMCVNYSIEGVRFWQDREKILRMISCNVCELENLTAVRKCHGMGRRYLQDCLCLLFISLLLCLLYMCVQYGQGKKPIRFPDACINYSYPNGVFVGIEKRHIINVVVCYPLLSELRIRLTLRLEQLLGYNPISYVSSFQ